VDTLLPLLEQSDFITVHMPMTPETDGILNAKTLAQCKKGVRLINCARGGLIREADLLEALQSGHVGGASLDVFETEPLAADSPFRSLPNVVLTPHLGASTAEAQESVGIEIAEAIYEILTEGVIRNAVNMPNVDARTLAAIRPYISLGEKLGSLLAQFAPKRLDSLTVNYSGTVKEQDTRPITRSILKGILKHSGGEAVNEVNAGFYAQSRGLKFSETKQSDICDFSELITARVTAGDETHEVAATFFGNRPRLVRLDGQSVEASPEGVLMVMENKDRPGIVGWIGTLLGRHKVNIATMSLSRAEVGSRALSILNLDSAPGADVLKEIESDPDIYSVKIFRI
jgi:D-3-phosphoglycerate dehydrogenase / 2-oxoglutarate reductase